MTMADAVEQLAEKAKALVGNWPTYTALGSFALYVLGYLTLRYHLTALGVGTDLAVLDERYVFSGAKFLVYLVSCVPIVVLLSLMLIAIALVITAVGYLPYRLMAASVQANVGKRVRAATRRIQGWWDVPGRLALAGIVVSVALIQFVMRQCFLFSNLLLAQGLPEPHWLGSLLLGAEELRTLYFTGLVIGTAAAAGLLFGARSRKTQTSMSRFLIGLLALLVVIQSLLLPVNYGMLIADKILPRVTTLGGQEPLKDGQQAWLVWEGNEGAHYLVQTLGPNGEARKLVTLPRKDVTRTEIVKYDSILQCIFSEGGCSE
jgi:hypothetical protein